MADAKGDAVIEQRDKKLIDVARLVGYESDAAFSKAFKRGLSGPTLGNTSNVVSEDQGHVGMADHDQGR